MLFLSLKHIFDTFVGYSNIQIVEAITISPLIRKYMAGTRFLAGSCCVFFRIEDFLNGFFLIKKSVYDILLYSVYESLKNEILIKHDT